MFGETSNKFRKGSPVLWYAAQAGEEWHWKEKKYLNMFFASQRSITKY